MGSREGPPRTSAAPATLNRKLDPTVSWFVRTESTLHLANLPYSTLHAGGNLAQYTTKARARAAYIRWYKGSGRLAGGSPKFEIIDTRTYSDWA